MSLPRSYRSYISSFSMLLCMLAISLAQTTPSGDARVALKAALVLTPEFCAKAITPRNRKNSVEIGRSACAELEPALQNVFSSLIRVSSASSPETEKADIVLIPRAVEASATGHTVTVLLEWNVKDRSGRTVWIGTVEGSANGSPGTLFTAKKNQTETNQRLLQDVIEQSAKRLAGSAELKQLAVQLHTATDGSAPRQTALAALPGATTPKEVAAGNNPNRYALEYVHLTHQYYEQTYDEISENIQAQMVAAMDFKGFIRGASSDGLSCKLTVEILTVKSVNYSWKSELNPIRKAPGVAVTASVKVSDGNGNVVSIKEYKGDSRVAPLSAESVKSLTDRAIRAMVKNVSTDQSFDAALTKALHGGTR